MVKRIFLILCCIGCCLTAAAQQTLNIHTTTQGVVSIAFAAKPIITFPTTDVMTVTSETMTVEFPYTDVEKLTFEDAADAVESIAVNDDISAIFIYNIKWIYYITS